MLLEKVNEIIKKYEDDISYYEKKKIKEKSKEKLWVCNYRIECTKEFIYDLKEIHKIIS